MTELKIVINDPKTGKSYKKELTKEERTEFLGKKIGDRIQGNHFGFENYEFEIRGGNDSSGFPMRYDIQGAKRKKAFLTSGPGVRIRRKGMKKRKTIAGNTISRETSNIALKIIKKGKKSPEEILGIKSENKKQN